jgi:hypothetical protein
MNVRGGIYIDKGTPLDEVCEFGLCIGDNQTLWFGVNDHIHTLFQLQEHGGMHNLELVEGYSFGINKAKNEFYVRDTGHKNCKHKLWTGTYDKDGTVEQDMKKLHKCLFY